MRTCPCGVEELRWMLDGREATNMDPVSGLCIPCLIARSRGPKVMPSAPADYKRAQAGERDK